MLTKARLVAGTIASVGAGACLVAGTLMSSSCVDTTRPVEDAGSEVDEFIYEEAGSSADREPPVAEPTGPVAYPIPGSCSGNEFIAVPFPTGAEPVTPCSFLGCCEDYVPPSGGKGG